MKSATNEDTCAAFVVLRLKSFDDTSCTESYSPIKQYSLLLHTTVRQLIEEISVAISVTPSPLKLFP